MAPRSEAVAKTTGATAFYARVTKEESAEASLPRQRERFEELADTHGWTAARQFIEDGAVHGDWDIDRRPALRELMAAVERGEIGRVVIRHLDRLGRGPVLQQVIDRLSRLGVEVWTFDGKQDLHSAAGRFAVGIQGVVGAFEIERTGERLREMRRQKARNGYYVGPNPFGYTSQARVRRELEASGLTPEEARREAETRFPHSGLLYVDEAEAWVIRDIFRLYNDGAQPTAIGKHLTAAGARTRGGRPWCSREVRRALQRPLYSGKVTFDEEGYKNARNAITRVRDQPRYDGKHAPIVSLEVFEQAEARWRPRLRLQTRPRSTYALSGFLQCALGHRAGGKGGKLAYYLCRPRSSYGSNTDKGGCTADAMPVYVAEAAVRQVLTELFGDPERLHSLLTDARRRDSRSRARQPTEADSHDGIQAALKRHKETAARCTDLLIGAAAGTPAETALLARLNAAQETIGQLRAELDAGPTARVYALPAAVSREQVAEFAANLRRQLDREDLRVVLEALQAHHGLAITILTKASLRVELDLDVAGTGRPSHVAWTLDLQRPPTPEEWLAAARKDPPLCGCGCGELIDIKPQHRLKGIPTYRPQHAPSAKSQMVAAFREEGLLTVRGAAKELGISGTQVRRRIRAGLIPHVTRKHGRDTYELIAAETVDALTAQPERIGLNDMLAALGFVRGRMMRLVRAGVLPPIPRDATGKPSYTPADSARYRQLIASWEQTVMDELADEGWLPADEACRRLGIGRSTLQRRIQRGELRSERRCVLTQRPQLFVAIDDSAAPAMEADTTG